MGSNVKQNLKYILRCVLKVIYDGDRGCAVCKSEYNIEPSRLICSSCAKKLSHDNIFFILEHNGESIPCYSFNYYRGIIKEMLFNLKYNRDFLCGEIFADYLYEIIKNKNIEFDIISFIPSSRKMLKKRGYNQSQVLAKFLNERLNSKVMNLLVKVKKTKDQIGLDGENRWQNVQGVFKCKKNMPLTNKTVLLVDDVITTGATVYYCVKELKENGANEVVVLSVAKSLNISNNFA